MVLRVGEAGYQTVVERFSIDAMVRQVQEVYDEELTRSGVVAVSSDGGSTAPAHPGTRAALEIPPL